MTEKPVDTTEMTPEAASALEREVILHAGDPSYVLLDGRTVAEVREAQAAKDVKDRAEAAEFWERSIRANTPEVATVSVRVSEAGTVISAPSSVKPAETEGGAVEASSNGEATNVATPLPETFPHRELLEGAGFSTVEKVRAATDEELISIDGVGASRLKEIRKALR
jgi:hypothetical protein